jgi:hypothetical protein
MKTIFTVIALCVAYSSFAQIEKGRSYLTGEIGGGSSKSDYHNQLVTGPSKQSSYSGLLSYGYLVADSWAIALLVSGSGNKVEYNNQNTSSGSGLAISPYVRKFFAIGEKLYLHLDGGVSYNSLESKYEQPSTPTVHYDTKITNVYVSPGLSYFVSDRFALTANLGSLSYVNSNDKTDGGGKTTRKGLNASFGLTSFSFGASIYF